MSLSSYEKRDLFDNIVSEITSKAKPEDVFDRDVLLFWASQQDLEEVYNNGELEEWASKNGYVKAETE